MPPDMAQRKLTTILAADVVGYSQLMATDEEATLATLQTYKIITNTLVGKHSGRVFSTAGDAFLAEFGSAVEAVRCAISIQEDLRVRNSQRSNEKQMWLRIGINVGDVMIDGEDLFGDGVNVAARLEALAEKGGICISGSAFEQVKNKLSIAFKDIGAQSVKNIPDPVAAYKLVPGQVAVNDKMTSTLSRTSLSAALMNRRLLLIAGSAIIGLLLVGVLVWNIVPALWSPVHPYDGRWKVLVSSLSGCLNNAPSAFPVNVVKGNMDHPNYPFPKKGTISSDGKFNIKSFDRVGNIIATLKGTITNGKGEGRFQGGKPTCHGEVMLVRMR